VLQASVDIEHGDNKGDSSEKERVGPDQGVEVEVGTQAAEPAVTAMVRHRARWCRGRGARWLVVDFGDGGQFGQNTLVP